MFTGIINHQGIVQTIQHQHTQWLIKTTLTPKFGESISVNGMCLTNSKLEKTGFWVDISPETLAKTTAKLITEQSVVNLEPALKMGDKLGGHWVSGHIDDIGYVESITPYDQFSQWVFTIPQPLMCYVVKKGSITIDGISLTVNSTTHKTLTCMIIPHTLKHTNLNTKKTGDAVNIETDLIAKHLEKLNQPYHHESKQ